MEKKMEKRKTASGKTIHQAKITRWVLRYILHLDVVESRRIGGTWMTLYKNKDGVSSYVYWQISAKDPWLLPHKEKRQTKHQMPLTGWLFFYFGKDTEKQPEKEETTDS